MVLTILLLTEPAEEARLAKGLRGSFRLRLRADLGEGPPHEQLLREQPDAIVLGVPLAEAGPYIEAIREYLPGCSICLLAERAQAEAARRLRPSALFLRPVKLTELVTTLEALGPGRLSTESRPPPIPPPAPSTPPAPSAPEERRRTPSASGLLRVDEMLLDPMALLGGGAAREPAAPPRRGKSASGQFQQLVVVPEELLGEAQAAAAPGKVSVDPAIYEDALSDIDVDALGADGAPAGARAGSAPPPIPADLGAARRRTDPPPIPPSPAAAANHSPAAGPPPSGPPPVPSDAPRRTTLPPVLPPAAPQAAASTEPAAPPPPPPPEGDLQQLDPPTLIGWLCTSSYSGCLQLSRDAETAQRQLFFDGGELVAAASTLPVDSLPELLYHEGRLSREQLKRARQLLEGAGADVSNRRLAQLLSDEQLLPRSEIAPLLRRHVIEIFYRSFAWEKGRYRTLTRAAPPEDRVRLKETPRLLLLEGLRRKASLESLLGRVGPESTVLRPVASGGLLLKDAGVTAFEQRALPLFDGRHSLQQISRQSGLAEHATYVLAYALMCLGGLRRPEPEAPAPRARPSGPGPAEPPRHGPPPGQAEASRPSGPPPSPPAASDGSRPGGPPPSPPAAASDNRAERAARARDRVRRKHAEVSAADYFAVLDLTEVAGGDEVRRAHEALRAEFGDALPQELQAELSAELGEIREVLGEAYAVLSSDELRAAYRAQLLPLPEATAPKG